MISGGKPAKENFRRWKEGILGHKITRVSVFNCPCLDRSHCFLSGIGHKVGFGVPIEDPFCIMNDIYVGLT